jgi:transposase
MAKPILDDELWALIEPLLPPPKPRRSRYPARKPLNDRALLTGILFILQTSLRWDLLPREMGCGSGMSCCRRLRDWQAAGVWTDCMKSCSQSCVRLTRLTGPVSSSIPPRFAQWVQVKKGTESHGPRAPRFKAPSHHRSAGHPARGNSHGRRP